MELVTIVIPAYNAGNFLKRCLDSVCCQSYSNLEIICVNDGSEDNTLEILKEYQRRDSRFIVISSKNHSAGYARNLGMSVARGDYYLFLDADDFFEKDMVEKAITSIQGNTADFCVFRSNTYNYSKKLFEKTDWTIDSTILPSKCFAPEDVNKNIFKLFVGWAWDKLYRASFVKKYKLYFQDQRTTNDLLFVFSSIVLADKICVINDVLVHHQRGFQSLANTREKSWSCFHDALIRFKSVLVENNLFERYSVDYKNYCLHASLWNLNSLHAPQQEVLYNTLKSKWFYEFGINSLTADTCYDPAQFRNYRFIINSEYSEYVGGEN